MAPPLTGLNAISSAWGLDGSVGAAAVCPTARNTSCSHIHGRTRTHVFISAQLPTSLRYSWDDSRGLNTLRDIRFKLRAYQAVMS